MESESHPSRQENLERVLSALDREAREALHVLEGIAAESSEPEVRDRDLETFRAALNDSYDILKETGEHDDPGRPQPCPVCDGRGEVTIDEGELRVCPACGGDGRLEL